MIKDRDARKTKHTGFFVNSGPVERVGEKKEVKGVVRKKREGNKKRALQIGKSDGQGATITVGGASTITVAKVPKAKKAKADAAADGAPKAKKAKLDDSGEKADAGKPGAVGPSQNGGGMKISVATAAFNAASLAASEHHVPPPQPPAPQVHLHLAVVETVAFKGWPTCLLGCFVTFLYVFNLV